MKRLYDGPKNRLYRKMGAVFGVLQFASRHNRIPASARKNFSIFTFQFSVFIVSLPIEKHVFMDAAMIKIIQDYFKTQPVLKAWLFGSYARGEETPDSDVDILVVFDKKARVSIIGQATMMLDLEDLLNKKIDLVKEGTLLPFAVQTANHDKLLIYEKSA